MCSDLQDWQKQITEYFSKQEGLPYHTGDPRRCGFVALYRKDWENFVCDNKDKITKQNRNHTIILKNNEHWVWVNPSNAYSYRGYKYHKILADKYMDEKFIKDMILPCCVACNSFDWF